VKEMREHDLQEKIMIVDDEAAIADLVEVYLKNEGYDVFKFYSATEALECVRHEELSLAILDVMMPDMDGFTLCRHIREEHFYPIIMLTAKVEDMDKITGLTLGADDYICKPFQIGELLARVETVLRRTQRMAERLEIDDVAIDPKSRTVTKAGEQVELTVKEFDLLYELMKNKNVALSRRRLYELVWQEEYTGETRTLDSHVQRLRKKLDWNEKIVTVFRIGYRLEVRG